MDITLLRSIIAIPDCITRIKQDSKDTLNLADLYFHLGIVLVLCGVPFQPTKHVSKRLANWWFDLRELEVTLTKLYAGTADYLMGKEFDTIGAIAACNKAQEYLSQLCKARGTTPDKLMLFYKDVAVSRNDLKVVKKAVPNYGKSGRPTKAELLEKLALPIGEELPPPKYKKNRKSALVGTRGKPYNKKWLRERRNRRRDERERLKKEKDDEKSI